MINLNPTVVLRNQSLVAKANIAASSFIAAISDPERDPITAYAFWDSGTGGGYFVLNGVVQAAGKWIVVSAADLASLIYVGASGTSTERIFVSVHDGNSWSATVSALAASYVPVNHVPVVSTSNVTVSANQTIAASAMIQSVTDADGNAITKYSFFDTGVGGGRFYLNGVAQADNHWIVVNAADLASLTYA